MNQLFKTFVPLKFELGEAFHFDWSEEGLVVGGTVPWVFWSIVTGDSGVS